MSKTKMKALVKSEAKPGLTLKEADVPKIGINDVLIRVDRTGICGTDVHIYKWDAWAQKTIPVPMVVGHEFVGEIAEIGRSVKGLKVGERVSGEGKRHLCPNTLGVGVNRHGSFAEYFNLPAENVFPIPKNIPDDVAGILDP